MRENFFVDLKIKDLLNLQEYDLERLKVESQLRTLPEDMGIVKGRIEEIKGLEKGKLDELKQIELKRNDLDRQLNEAEERVRKFKTQQMSIKKSDEYEAMTKAIEREEALVDQLANEQLELLGKIDEFREKIKTASEGYQEQIRTYEDQISYLRKQEHELKEHHEKLKSKGLEAEKVVDPIYLKKYHQVLRSVKRGPYVVALEGNRCQGCHLTVSNEVLGLVRQGGKPAQCDSCSRILYLSN